MPFELVDSGLSALTRQTQQPVLMNIAANVRRQAERANGLQALDMSQHGIALGSPGDCRNQASLLMGQSVSNDRS